MNKLLRILSYAYVGFSLLCLLAVSLMAWLSPQQVMELVRTRLDNTDALSSIRGVYGAVGLFLVLLLAYLAKSDLRKAVLFLVLFWGLYALARAYTWGVDGALGPFGQQWITVESALATVGLLLYLLARRK
ncbi:DUF4345 domain-containing protein [Olivibacter sitiensis]|uniref:DUF4345 domain-containing protein n=1 Tax=Olivibacter sitiensis TaxID=376470 RepID=UPI00048235B4|nr:DUF4345 domain-containing protein [Olivibacter sitiensis]